MCKLPNKSVSAQLQATNASLGMEEDASKGNASLGEVDSMVELQKKPSSEDSNCNCDSLLIISRVDSMDKCKVGHILEHVP